jgi:hypothetical protein
MPESGENLSGPESYGGIDFGTRKCEICLEEIETPKFGGHVFGQHAPEIQAKWPGGITGLLGTLRESLATSIEAATGRPDVQFELGLSMLAIDSLLAERARMISDLN